MYLDCLGVRDLRIQHYRNTNVTLVMKRIIKFIEKSVCEMVPF
jgi:hypothetical protein